MPTHSPVGLKDITPGDKYRAAYAVDGVRRVGFGNRRSKGDHCHIDGHERPCLSISVEKLVEDFIAAVDTARSAP